MSRSREPLESIANATPSRSKHPVSSRLFCTANRNVWVYRYRGVYIDGYIHREWNGWGSHVCRNLNTFYRIYAYKYTPSRAHIRVRVCCAIVSITGINRGVMEILLVRVFANFGFYLANCRITIFLSCHINLPHFFMYRLYIKQFKAEPLNLKICIFRVNICYRNVMKLRVVIVKPNLISRRYSLPLKIIFKKIWKILFWESSQQLSWNITISHKGRRLLWRAVRKDTRLRVNRSRRD